MRRKFILNPSAGKNLVRKSLDTLKSEFKDFDHVCTKSRDDAAVQTRAALRAGYDQIVAVGGDGTLNAIVNGFFENGQAVNPSALLVVTRWGTGCDYFRTVGGDARWQDLVTDYTAEAVDVGEIRYQGERRAPVYFTNIGSVGMSAEVVTRQRGLPAWLPALASYAVPSLQTLLTYRPTEMRVSLDGKVYDGKFLNVFFAKGKTCGGGMKLGGGVSLADGELDITLIHGMGLLASLPRFAKLFTGKFGGDPMFTKTKARVVEIQSAKQLSVECDGEVIGTTDIRVTLKPKAIRVCFPRVESRDIPLTKTGST